MLVNEKRTEPNSVFAATGHPALRKFACATLERGDKE